MSTFMLSLLMTLVVAALTAAATSVRTVSRIWLRHWTEQQLAGGGGEAPTTDPTLYRPTHYLLAAGTGVAVAVFALGAMVTFRTSGVAVLEHLAVATVLLLVLGQVLPRTLAMRWGTRLIPVLAPLLRMLHAMFGPILGFAARLVRRVAAPASPPPTDADPLEDLLREAEAEGIGSRGEAEIISGVVEFGETRVREVMTPRDRVVAVASSMSGGSIAQLVAGSHYSRVPVFDDRGRVVLGVLHAFDILVYPTDPLAGVRPAAAATPDDFCGVVMRRMLRDHRHLAVVQAGDEVVGIVTLEDLMEELVGEIRDEHDEPGATA